MTIYTRQLFDQCIAVSNVSLLGLTSKRGESQAPDCLPVYQSVAKYVYFVYIYKFYHYYTVYKYLKIVGVEFFDILFE